MTFNSKVLCPKFGHPTQTSVWTPYTNFGHLLQVKSLFLHGNNNFATIVNGQSVLKLFQLSNGNFFRSMSTANPVFSALWQNLELTTGCPNLGHTTLFDLIAV